MTQTQLLHEFGQLAMPQQLELLREALRLMQQTAPAGSPALSGVPTKKSLSDAAALLLDDYAHDAELTSFTALDGEPVHATQ
ncbi:MAG: hypothetical protein AABP62_30405 [Planctomycetota bacterium]